MSRFCPVSLKTKEPSGKLFNREAQGVRAYLNAECGVRLPAGRQGMRMGSIIFELREVA